MDPITLGYLGIAVLVILVVIGVPVAYASAFTGIVGMMILRNPTVATGLSGIIPYANSGHYALSVLPLFITIGFLAMHAGITTSAYDAARKWVGRAPGGLATATIFASAGFAAVSGASTASTAVFTRLALPEMEAHGYDSRLAAGVVAVGGTLAALIPPSAILVIYGIIVEQSVAKLLMAGLLPGLLSMIVYLFVITVVVKLNPGLAPLEPSTTFMEKIRALPQVGGVFAVVGVILGGIYLGWMTPTESAGVATAIILGMALFKRIGLKDFHNGLLDTVRTTVMIFMVIWGVLIFVRFLAFTGLPASVTDLIVSLDVPRWMILIGIIVMYLLMGMILDGLGMMMLTLPVVFPAIVGLGYDPIWFGILLVKLIEVGVVTPPVGLNCYVVNGIRPDIPLESVFRGVAPFLVGEIFIIAIIVLFPDLVLLLPNLMN
ncbi:TRAP transporter large permease [Seohaeicola zhoushanensis]|uniref:C4-dicarboxylate ABC transporter permease n=1 Tax=Seohaeicola zhoushanensis TaxID=1569283 RepID=A0A8J3GXT8_9RHOB|nr:TRAP transporter large permease [Seohaeicola zhoushanensis]GHF48449.1 C4-dicarboxylate ABC transporter permease [Seohaeicola zhoushanensis]